MNFPTRITEPAPIRSLFVVGAAVFLIALSARVAFLETNGVQLTPDSADYILLAKNLRAHGAFSLEAEPPLTPTIRRAPLYPVFLAAFVRPGGISINGVVAAQIIMDAAVAVFVFLLVFMIIPSVRWAVGAGLTYALYPGAIYVTPSILSEPSFTFFLVAGVLSVVIAFQQDAPKWSAVGGILLGLAALCRTIALPLPFLFSAVLILIVGVCVVPMRFSRRLLHSALLIGCTALVVVPWTIRCTRLSERLVIVQGATSVLFYAGTRTDWNQKDQESLWRKFATEDPFGRRVTTAKTPKELADADQVGSELAFQNIRANPRGYLSLRARTFPFLFLTSFDNFTGLHKSFSMAYREGAWLTLFIKATLLIGFSLAPTILGVIGLWGSWRNVAAALASLVWIYTAAINFPMWIEYRYWVPVIPFLLVSSTAGLHLLVTKLNRKLRRNAE